MLENMPKPMTEISVAPVAKLRSVKTVRSRIGSAAVSSRIRNAASVITATIAIAVIVTESNHSSRSPRSRTSWRHPKPTIMSPSPHQSIRAAFFWNGGSNRQALARRKPTIPTGRLM
jgi:hypothetical protein